MLTAIAAIIIILSIGILIAHALTRCLSVGLVNLLVERRPPKPELQRLESM
jgi:hypothetical protein